MWPFGVLFYSLSRSVGWVCPRGRGLSSIHTLLDCLWSSQQGRAVCEIFVNQDSRDYCALCSFCPFVTKRTEGREVMREKSINHLFSFSSPFKPYLDHEKDLTILGTFRNRKVLWNGRRSGIWGFTGQNDPHKS